MIKHLTYIVSFIFLLSCSQFNKGVIEKRELRKGVKNPPSVQIAKEYDKQAKKYQTKTYSNPKRAAKAREKAAKKHKKQGDRYLKRKKRKSKKKRKD